MPQDDPYKPPQSSPQKKFRGLLRPLQRWLLMLIVASATLGVYVMLVRQHRIDASAALYIGLPVVLAYVFAMTDRSSSAMGATMKGITLTLLLSAPILQEGFICILFAAPIFYAVGAVVAILIDNAREKRLINGKLKAHPAVLLLGLLALEGTHDNLSFDRLETVRVSKLVNATPAAIEAQLARPVNFDRDRPLFLRIFPFPVPAGAGGIETGDRQRLQFTYFKHFWFNAQRGDLVFEVTARNTNAIDSRVVQDTSYLNTYMALEQSRVSWQAVNTNQTHVVWEIRYRRKLDPAWYFGPLQAYATRLIAEQLIDNAATPPTEEDGSHA